MNPRLCSSLLPSVIRQLPRQCNESVLRKKLCSVLSSHLTIIASRANAPNLSQHRSNSSIHHFKPGLKTMDYNASSGSGSDGPQQHFTSVMNVGEADGWLSIGQYNVFAWSVSGVESCIIVKSEDMQVVFDMGIAAKDSVKVPNVFISHGHIDHIGGITNHIAKRSLFGMKPARYFVPPHLVNPLKTVVQAFSEMSEQGPTVGDVNILPILEGETIHLNSRFFVKTFPTVHRVKSQGYIIYKEEKTLKQEFRGMEGFKVAALHREGKEIHDVVVTPEIAYTGDTMIDVFTNPPTPDLLQVKLLITEATFLDENDKRGNSMIDKARARGHIHLVEISQNADLFDNVGHILLVHFSSKYTPKYICDSIRDKLPSRLRAKVTPATVAANTKPSTYL